jgi:hypothetical protein
MHPSSASILPWRALSGLLLSVCLLQPAVAEDDDLRLPRVPLLRAYQQECSACHMAYPPGLLPASSWRRLMQDLPHHFGTDASVDPKTLSQLSAWLDRYAASDRTMRPPAQDRITKSAWFADAHEEISPTVWRRKAVGSPSNCMACHAQADQGVFDEHDVRIPR